MDQTLTLEVAQQLIADALQQARTGYGRPICVSVCDAQGFQVAFARETGAPLRSIAIATQKAYTVVRMGSSTEAFLARLHKEQLEISFFCDSGLTAIPGGSPLKDAGGRVYGAIGISGLVPAEDQAVTDHVAAQFASR
jgi:glc operon protein GlcG